MTFNKRIFAVLAAIVTIAASGACGKKKLTPLLTVQFYQKIIQGQMAPIYLSSKDLPALRGRILTRAMGQCRVAHKGTLCAQEARA